MSATMRGFRLNAKLRNTLIGICLAGITAMAGCDLQFNSAVESVVDERAIEIAVDAGIKSYPSWSPDGRKIVYSAQFDSSVFSLIKIPDEMSETLIVIEERVQKWQFSPDGSKLAWTTGNPEGRLILRIRDLSSGKTQTINRQDIWSFMWSPSGKKIAYYSRYYEDIYNNNRLLVFDTTLNTEMAQVSSNPATLQSYNWSPDGHALVLQLHGARDQIAIWEIGSELEIIAPDTVRCISPSWSPDGRMLLFQFLRVTVPGSRYQVAVWDAENGIRTLTPDSTHSLSPTWFPTENRILFRQDEINGYILKSIRPDGSDLQIFNDEIRSGEYAWSPDGSRLACNAGGYTYLLGRDGTIIERLTNHYPINWHWNNDGFINLQYTSGARLQTFVLSDSSVHLVKNTTSASPVAWLPDGENIIRDGGNILYRLNLNTGQETPLPLGASDTKGAPAVSPDGRWLAYTSDQALLVTRLQEPFHDATTIFGSYSEPSWSPDNSAIVCSNPKNYGLTIIKLLDGKPIDFRDLHEETGLRHPKWSPEYPGMGSRISVDYGQNTYVFSPNEDERLFSFVFNGRDLTWSPDASRISFVRDGRLYIANAFTSFAEGDN